MAVTSDNVKEVAINLLALIFIGALSYLFFGEDSAEAVSQSYIEAALDGDGETMAELSTKYMPYLGRVNFKLDHPKQRDLWDGLMKETDISHLNKSLEQSQQKLARRLVRRVKDRADWDEVEIIGIGIKELPTVDRSFRAWMSSFLKNGPWYWMVRFWEDDSDEPGYVEDEVGLAIARITFDDESLGYMVLALTHVARSEYTIEGWTVTKILRTSHLGPDYDEDEIESREEKLQELLNEFEQAA